MQDFTNFIKRLKLEALALAILMVVLTELSSAPLWILPATFLFFDIGMLGYIKNPRFGALTYNATHDLTLPTLCIAFGALFSFEWIAVLGFCWTFHIAFDRFMGYGLKHQHSFHETHLGSLKKNK